MHDRMWVSCSNWTVSARDANDENTGRQVYKHVVKYVNMMPVHFSFEYFITRACIMPFSAHLIHIQILFYYVEVIIIWPWWSSQQMLVNARDILFGELCTIVTWSCACWRRVVVFAAVIQMWVLGNRGLALFSSFVLICRALPTGSAPRTVPWHSISHTLTRSE